MYAVTNRIAANRMAYLAPAGFPHWSTVSAVKQATMPSTAR